MVPFMINKLGAGDYGTYILATSFAGYFSFMTFGVGETLQKYVAEYHAKAAYNYLNKIIIASLVFYSFMGLLTGGLLAGLAAFFVDVFQFSEAELSKAKTIVYVVAVVSLISWPASIFASILKGIQKYTIVNKISFIVSLFSTAAIVVLITRGYSIISLVIATNLFGLLGWLIQWIMARRHFPNLQLKWQQFEFAVLKSIFGFSIHLFLMRIARLLTYHADRLILAFFMPVQTITFYEVVTKPQYWIRTVTKITNGAVMPAISEAQAVKNRQFMRRVIFWGSRYTLAAVLAMVIPFMLVSKEFLGNWIGVEYEVYAFEMQLFISYLIFSAANGLIQAVMIGMGQVKELSVIALVSGIANVILSIILVQLWGLLGILLATVFIALAVTPVYIAIFSKRIKVPFFQFLREIYLAPYLIGAGVAILLFFLKSWWQFTNLTWVIGFIVVGISIYLFAFFTTGTSREEKAFIRSYFHIPIWPVTPNRKPNRFSK